MTPILRHFGQAKLSKIDQVAIDTCAKALYPKGKSSTLIRQVYTPVSAVMQHAAARGMCTPITIERPSPPKGKTRWLTVEEAGRLVAACSDHLRPVVLLMLYTGARVSEALYLDWAQVNLAAGSVVYLDTKNGEDRGVPLHPALIAALSRSNRREGPVFLSHKGVPYEEKAGEGGQIKTAFQGATRRAGLGKWVDTKKKDKDGKPVLQWTTDVTPHTCRHTWATWHYAAHRDIRQLMELGGWKQISMVQRYTHVNVSNHAPSIAALPSLGDCWGSDDANTEIPPFQQEVG
ncbi:site-specific integrase [Bosea minatitlanensis]